jgi:hypothetical protein
MLDEKQPELLIAKLSNPPISDEKKLLEIVVNAVTSKSVDPILVKQAVTQAVFNYENQLRVFMVAAANAQLARIIRLIQLIDRIEERVEKGDFVNELEPKDLLRLYALHQANLTNSLDYIKKIADMRLEMHQAESAISSAMTNSELEEVKNLSGLPKLTAKQRTSVRRLIENMSASMIDVEVEKDTETVDL